MKKLSMLLLFFVLGMTLVGCKQDNNPDPDPDPDPNPVECDPGYTLVGEDCIKDDIPYDESLFTPSEDVPMTFLTEPSRYQLIEDVSSGLNIVYQYDMPVPSFDTWDNLEANREKIDLNGSWTFAFDNDVLGVDGEYYLPDASIPDSFTVSVPSNWDFYNEDVSEWYNYQNNDFDKVEEYWTKMYGWYTRTFEIEEGFLEDRFVRLNSLGMVYRAWIFINGQYVESHDGAYEYFSINVGEYLKEGENTIAILLYRKPVYETYSTGDTDIDERAYADAQFMPHTGIATWNFGGLHRDIWLESSDTVTVSKVLLNAHDNQLETYTVLYNTGDEDRTVAVDIFAHAEDTNPSYSSPGVTVPANGIKVLTRTIDIPDVEEWSYVTPNVYEMKVEIYEDGNIIDSLHSTYGMRTIETYSNEPGVADGAGILLNSHEIKLKGFGWNDDFYSESLQTEGTNISREMYEFQVDTIRNQMDANFVRNLQNDRHPRAYDVMDEYGLMSMQETPFHWLNTDITNYQLDTYGAMEMILAVSVWNNMNHPSIIMYSLLNEPTYPESPDMVKATRVLNELVKKIDVQDRLTTVCLRAIGQWWTDIGDHVDVYSFNEKNGHLGTTAYDIFGTEMNPDLDPYDGMQPLRYKIGEIIKQYPDLPILFSEPGAWQYNRTDTFIYQMREYNMMKEQWKIIIEEPQYHSIGFTLFTYNEYKTTHLGSDGDGIAGFGVVPYNYSPEYLEAMEPYAGILPPIETLGRYFDTLEYGIYAYPEPD